jgi:hypothetical protein
LEIDLPPLIHQLKSILNRRIESGPSYSWMEI